MWHLTIIKTIIAKQPDLLSQKRKVNGKSFSGGNIRDMEDNIKQILRYKRKYIILHLGTNDALNFPQHEILYKIRSWVWGGNFWSIPYIKENCHNSRTSDNIDTKIGQVTKIDKRNKTASKKYDGDVMLVNFDVIAIFSIYDQFGEIQKPDSGHTVCTIYIFINSNLLSYKNWKQK